MNAGAWVIWAFGATVLLTVLMAGSQGLGFTRMNLPFMLGTVFTPHRDRAKVVGALVHFANGLLFALVYVFAFRAWGGATWWRGALLGLCHAALVLVLRPGVRTAARAPGLPGAPLRLADAALGGPGPPPVRRCPRPLLARPVRSRRTWRIDQK